MRMSGLLRPLTSLLRASTYRRAAGIRPLQRPLFASSVRAVGVVTNTRLCHHGTTSDSTSPGCNSLKLVGHTFSLGCQVATATADHEARYMEVEWQDGSTTHYPYLWLRDNCTCDSCFDDSLHERLFIMRDLDINSTPTAIQVDREVGSVQVTWSDGHVSRYGSDWLQGHSFTTRVQEEHRKWLQPREAQHWGAELADNIPTFNFQQLLEDDKSLYDWITALEEVGLALIKETPQTTGQVKRLGSRVAFLKITHYGDDFIVETKMDPTSLAYTSCKLGLHTDLPYYYFTPGMQMLHCIKHVNTEGGENQLVDGFRVAEILKDRHPEMFDLLVSTYVDFQDMGKDSAAKYFKMGRQPTIGLDLNGKINKISFSDQHRDSFLHLPLDIVNRLYVAMKTFTNIAYEAENHFEYKVQAGDTLCFHNTRIMHGRTDYRVLEGGDRYLQGGYIDWDDLHCRRRVLITDLKLYEEKEKGK